MDTKAYFESIRAGNVEALRQLLASQPELLAATTSAEYAPDKPLDCTGLHAAVHAGKPEIGRVLIDAGIDIEVRSKEGRTALHDSIELGVEGITTLLLERGAELDICSAAILGRLDRLRELLDADPGLANERSTGLSPLGWASFGNQVETARELIERGARMDDGELLCAASVGHVEVGRFLIEKGADPDDSGRWGKNALHAAAGMRYTHDSSRFVEMLLDHGADINARTEDGQTALQILEARAGEHEQEPAACGNPVRRNYAGVAELLRERGAAPG